MFISYSKYSTLFHSTELSMVIYFSVCFSCMNALFSGEVERIVCENGELKLHKVFVFVSLSPVGFCVYACDTGYVVWYLLQFHHSLQLVIDSPFVELLIRLNINRIYRMFLYKKSTLMRMMTMMMMVVESVEWLNGAIRHNRNHIESIFPSNFIIRICA